MKLLQWTDNEGLMHRSLVRNEDEDPALGIKLDPPALNGFGLALAIRRDLHNELMTRGVLTWADVIAQQKSVSTVVHKVANMHKLGKQREYDLRRQLLALYRYGGVE